MFAVVSIAVPQTSPSPWAACGSANETNPPSTLTGRWRIDPAFSSLLSILPPKYCGGIIVCFPFLGAVPTMPRNGLTGISTPSRKPFLTDLAVPCLISHITISSLNSFARTPKFSKMAVQPQSPDSTSSNSIFSASPGLAPSTKTGPTAPSTLSQFILFRSSLVDFLFIWNVEESGMLKVNTSF
jgi:hypothetical protein